MKKYEIVKKNFVFTDIINTGRVLKGKGFHIYYKDNILSYPCFGLAVSKKFGHAYERNKIKRQLRMIIDSHKNLFAKSKNYIIMVRGRAKDMSYALMEEDIVCLLQKGFKNEEN